MANNMHKEAASRHIRNSYDYIKKAYGTSFMNYSQQLATNVLNNHQSPTIESIKTEVIAMKDYLLTDGLDDGFQDDPMRPVMGRIRFEVDFTGEGILEPTDLFAINTFDVGKKSFTNPAFLNTNDGTSLSMVWQMLVPFPGNPGAFVSRFNMLWVDFQKIHYK